MTEETSLQENKNPQIELSFTEKLLAKNGEADANFLSVWAFGYLDEIFSKGNQQPLQERHQFNIC